MQTKALLLLRSPDRREFVLTLNLAYQPTFFERTDCATAHTGRTHDLIVFEPSQYWSALSTRNF